MKNTRNIGTKIGKFLKSGFGSTGLSVEKVTYDYENQPYLGYVVYQNSVMFWIPTKNRIVTCTDLDELKEVDKRLELGLNINSVKNPQNS